MGALCKSCLSLHKPDRLIEYFVAGTTARSAANLRAINRKTAAFFFHRLHEAIASELEQESLAMFTGAIEVDEHDFGGARRSKRGRGAAGKPVYFLAT